MIIIKNHVDPFSGENFFKLLIVTPYLIIIFSHLALAKALSTINLKFGKNM